MRADGSWTVNLCDSCSNCAALHPITRESVIDGRLNKMREIGLFIRPPNIRLSSGRLATERREILTGFLGSRDV